MMHLYRIEKINHNDIKAGKYGGSVDLNTYTEKVYGLDYVWQTIGRKLKRERAGYSGIIDGIEYRVTMES